MEMKNYIDKDDLKGKFVSYFDKDSSYRTHEVMSVSGNTLTVRNVVGTRCRIHPDKQRIMGRQFRKLGLQPIKWRR